MKIDFEGARLYVRPGSTDLRKGVTGLLAIIENEMLKIIFWNKTGFWLAQKRLEMATWPWPNTSQEAREINTEQFEMLLAGIDFWRAHEEIKFDSVF